MRQINVTGGHHVDWTVGTMRARAVEYPGGRACIVIARTTGHLDIPVPAVARWIRSVTRGRVRLAYNIGIVVIFEVSQ